MPFAGTGSSRLADPRAAGEAAALDALLACDGARYLLLFASDAHADRLGAVVAGAQGLAGDIQLTACAARGVVVGPEVEDDGPAVVALAIGGGDFFMRSAEQPGGPADGAGLGAQLGAPRDMNAIVLLPGPAAGDPAAIARAMAPAGWPPVVGAAPGLVAATADGPHVDPGGTHAWLLFGPWALVLAEGPGFAAAPTPWAFGLYLGGAADPAADLRAIRARFPGLPVVGLAGPPDPRSWAPGTGVMVLVGTGGIT